ncbi:MAG: Csu type fimbrial protein [Vulcanimicrobiaceae bacterium]
MFAAASVRLEQQPADALLSVCTITPSPVTFGSYDPLLASPVTASAPVTISCTLGLLVSATVTLGTGGSGTFFPRTMSGPSSLQYQLFTDAAHTIVWGDGTAGTATNSYSSLLGGNATFTVYGQIPAAQSVKVGSYSDTVVETVDF